MFKDINDYFCKNSWAMTVLLIIAALAVYRMFQGLMKIRTLDVFNVDTLLGVVTLDPKTLGAAAVASA